MRGAPPRPLRRSSGRARAPHVQYDEVADASAALVIDAYSSSFGLASRLLHHPVRSHVRNVYALVRVADEVVDAPRPGQDVSQRARALSALREETLTALGTGQSSNLVVHAFARTAAACGIEPELVTPFFSSMHTDLERREHDEDSFAEYVYGSAEVVGLMCLRTFVAAEDDPAARYAELAPGARRLGAAFQKVNFLRDLGEDLDGLDRAYFPGVDPRRLSDDQRDALLDDIDADLHAAAAVIPSLPDSARTAVCAAHDLFADLSARLRRTPAASLHQHRVRVPNPVKARLVAAALLRGGRPRSLLAATP